MSHQFYLGQIYFCIFHIVRRILVNKYIGNDVKQIIETLLALHVLESIALSKLFSKFSNILMAMSAKPTDVF